MVSTTISSHQTSLNKKINTSSLNNSLPHVELLSTKLKAIVPDGCIIDDPGGEFQKFILILEDAVISHLMDIKEISLSQFVNDFFEVALEVDKSFDPSDSTYVHSPIGIIRICIRTIVAAQPFRFAESIIK